MLYYFLTNIVHVLGRIPKLSRYKSTNLTLCITRCWREQSQLSFHPRASGKWTHMPCQEKPSLCLDSTSISDYLRFTSWPIFKAIIYHNDNCNVVIIKTEIRLLWASYYRIIHYFWHRKRLQHNVQNNVTSFGKVHLCTSKSDWQLEIKMHISIHDWKILQFIYAITRVTEGQSHWKGSVGISKTRSSERNWCMQIAYHHQGSLTYQHYTVWAAIIATNRRFSWISKIRSHQSNNLTYTNPLLAYTTSFPEYSLDHKMKLQHSIGHR